MRRARILATLAGLLGLAPAAMVLADDADAALGAVPQLSERPRASVKELTAAPDANAARRPPAPVRLRQLGYLAWGLTDATGAASASARYRASGTSVRGVGTSGHGGFLRLEQGGAEVVEAGGALVDRHVLALDLGYVLERPVYGTAEDGFVASLELGLSSWHASSVAASVFDDESVAAGAASDGFGLSLGAGLEARARRFRLGVVVLQREIPMVVGDPTASASSTTVQVLFGDAK